MSRHSRVAVGSSEIAVTSPAMQRMLLLLGGWSRETATVLRQTGAPDGLRQTVSAVQGLLHGLSQREEQVVCLHYGIGTRAHSPREICLRLGVMPHQVERLERRAFRKLRDTVLAEEVFEGSPPLHAPSGGADHPSPSPPTPPPPSLDSDPVPNVWDEV
jgi:DNA-binding CsgD family transcriptional regulator